MGLLAWILILIAKIKKCKVDNIIEEKLKTYFLELIRFGTYKN